MYFQNFLKELDVAYLESVNIINTGFDTGVIAIFEAGEEANSAPFIEKIEATISRIIEKIKKIFQDAKEKLAKFFTDKNVEQKCKQVDEVSKNDPEVKRKKSSYKSRHKAIELDKITLEDIYKARDFNEVEAAMQKYRKQRNKAIAIGTVVTITVVGVGAFVLKKQKELNDTLSAEKEHAEAQLKKSKNIIGKMRQAINDKNEKIKSLQNDVSDLKKENAAKTKGQVAKVKIRRTKRKVFESTSKAHVQIQTQQAKANATVEVSTNICKDIVSESSEMMKSLIDPNVSAKTKVSNVVGTVTNTVKTVKGASDTVKEESIDTLKSNLSSLKSMGNKQQSKVKKIREALRNTPQTDPKYKKLCKLYKKENSKLKDLVEKVKATNLAIADNEKNI